MPTPSAVKQHRSRSKPRSTSTSRHYSMPSTSSTTDDTNHAAHSAVQPHYNNNTNHAAHSAVQPHYNNNAYTTDETSTSELYACPSNYGDNIVSTAKSGWEFKNVRRKLPQSNESPKPPRLPFKSSTFLLFVCIFVVFATLLSVDVYQFHLNVTQDQQLSWIVTKLSKNQREKLDNLPRIETRNFLDATVEQRFAKQGKRSVDDGFKGPLRQLPSALIIGARKSGTRALLEALALHPDLRTARHEVHFFDNDTNYARGVEWYREQMPRTIRTTDVKRSTTTPVTIEKTPAYFTSSLAPARVYEFNPQMKLILIVRNPVTRAISDYSQVHANKLARNKPHDSFENLVFNQSTRLIKPDYKPVRNSLYAKHLRRWLAVFPLAQIHVVDGENFVKSPLEEIKRIEQFLNLKSKIKPEQMEFNPTKGFYCFRRNTTGNAKCLGDSKGRKHQFVSSVTKRRLANQLIPYNRKFFNLIGRTFDW